ncbi:hypothetical protein D3C80_2210410 [compost metagenome]
MFEESVKYDPRSRHAINFLDLEDAAVVWLRPSNHPVTSIRRLTTEQVWERQVDARGLERERRVDVRI